MTDDRDKRQPWFTERDAESYADFLGASSAQSQKNFRILLSTVSEVLGETDLDSLLKKLVSHTIATTHAERGILLLANEQGKLEVEVALDAAGHDLGDGPPMSHTIPEQVMKEGQPVIERVSGTHDILDVSLSASMLKLRQLMCAPLRARGKAIGVLYVDSKLSGDERTESDLKLFHAQTGLIGLAIENHRLFREAWEMRDVQRQLETAREIQERLYPKSPVTYNGVELAGLSVISAQVGGDYFDYLKLDDERVGLGIGDVSGHGIAPALMMSDVRGHLRSLLQSRGALDGVYGIMNQALGAELAEGMYVALFVAVYHKSMQVLEFQNAGHVAPLLFRTEEDSFHEIRPNAPALGVFHDFSAGLCPRLPIKKGDVLVCYTDGVTDRPDANGEMYGEHRLKQAVRGAVHSNASPTEIAETVQAHSDAFAHGRPLRDDFTVMVVRF